MADIELSAIAAGTGGFVISGQGASDCSGFSVSSAGDVNGDGLDDLIIGAPGSDPLAGTDAGRSYVVFGQTGTGTVDLGNLGTAGFVITGPGAGDFSGHSIAAAGDINGDGLADLIVGAYKCDPAALDDAGCSYVVFGHTGTTTVDLGNLGTAGFVINGQGASEYSGFSVSAAGDVNGDGLADLIVGAKGGDPAAGADAGRAYVVFGQTGSATVELFDIDNLLGGGFAINGQDAGDSSGFSVSAAGDVNGDGLADLIVGAPRGDPGAGTDAGRSYVVFGQTAIDSVDLSAIAGGTGGFVINGQGASDYGGFSVSAAGDVNGDGLADLIVGAYLSDPLAAAGRSYVVFGQTGATAIDLSAVAAGTGGFVINGQAASDYSGFSVASAGDVNGDGLSDLIIGAKLSDPASGTDAGRSYVVFGQTATTAIDLSAVAAGTGGFVINGQGASDHSGNSVAAAGDVNGDGLADLIVGAKYADPSGISNAGSSYVIFGSTAGVFASTAVDQMGTTGADNLPGTAGAETIVAGAGNDTLTGNGGADVLYGGAGNDNFVISADNIAKLGLGVTSGNYARIDGGSGTDTVTLAGSGVSLDLTAIANQGGAAPSSASRIESIERIDLTGSGNNSLTLSAGDVVDMAGMNSFNNAGGWSGLGSMVRKHQLVIDGNAADVVTLDGYWTATGATVSNNGHTYAVYNASGVAAQVLVDISLTCNVHIVVDLSEIAAGTGGFGIIGQSDNDRSGNSVAAAGDVNGDGLDDLIVGAYNSSSYSGRSYVVFGQTGGTVINLSAIAAGTGGFVINGQGANDYSGFSVSSAGDVNGDGLSDLIIGAKLSDPASGTDAGRSYVVFGHTGTASVNLGSLGTGGFVIDGETANDWSGFSVSSAGDVNGDGLSDLIIGAKLSDPASGTDAGRSYVVFGHTGTASVNLGSLGTGGFVINGQGESDYSGFSVAAAGDVNGDGLGDLIVGTFQNYPAAGHSYVVFGKTGTTAIDLSAVAATTGGFVINGQDPNDHSGNSVAAAGDVNGDGLADLIVGAYNRDFAAPGTQGCSYVVFGQTATTAIDLSAVAAGTGGFVIKG